MTPSFPREFQPAVLRIPHLVASGLTPTGLSPSTAPRSSGLRLHPLALGGVLQHHIHPPLREGVRFGLCRFRSPLLTASRLLSFPAGTRMFPFPAFPLPYGSAPEGAGLPIRGSRVLRLLAPPPGFSQLGTPFVGARAEPSTGRDNRRKSLTGPSKHLGTPLHGLITHVGLNPSPATFPSPGARIKQLIMDSSGFEPEASASQRRRSTRLSYEPMGLPAGGLRRESPSVGGDPAADSPTATLLRLSPPRGPWARPAPKERASPLAHSGGLTGGVCKEQGRIHRAILRRDYYGFQVHEGELQPSIPG